MQSSLTDSYKQVVKRCFSHKSEARCRRSSGSAAQFHHVITTCVHVDSGSLYAKHIHPSFCFQCSLLNSRPGRYTLTQVGKSLCVCVCVCCRVSREFGRWKVNSLAVEKRDGLGGSGGLALPLDPDFMHTIRQLGRRPTLQTITDSLIKKYGTHLLVSATLGGTVEYAELQSQPDSHSF